MTDHEKVMANFNELIVGDTPVLVDFYAAWCGPCKMMHPILEDLKKQMGDDLKIIKLDIESRNNIKVVQQYRIRSVPTLMLFRNGKLLWNQTGALPAHDLRAVIEQSLEAKKE